MSDLIGGLIFIVLGSFCLFLYANKDKDNKWGLLYNAYLDVMPYKPGGFNYKWGLLGAGIQIIIVGILIIVL